MFSNKNHTKKFIVILLCIAFAFAFSGCSESSDTDSIAGIEYTHYESDSFMKDCSKLEKMSSENSEASLLSLYDDLYDQCTEIDTLDSVIYILYSEDVTDKQIQEEQLYTHDTLLKCCDRLCEVCHKITSGPCSDAFRKHVGDDAFAFFEDYEAMTKEEKKLAHREQKLINDYYEAVDRADSKTIKYKGRKWTFEMLQSDEGERLAVSDYEGYSDLYDRLLKNTNSATGPIYVKLVKIRDRIAELAGYDNYADYADTEIYYRDYSAEDTAALREEVKKISSEYYENLYTGVMYGIEPTMPEMTTDEMLKVLARHTGRIDPAAKKAAGKLIKDKLYSISDRDKRQDGAFTSYIYDAKVPYLFMTTDGLRDFAVLTHEFGHFVEFDSEKHNNILSDDSNTDLSEIASNGHEALMTRYYDRIFGDESDMAKQYVIQELLSNIVDGCIMDEFQRKVYENPDMSLEDINKTFGKIYNQYDPMGDSTSGYTWVFVNHNFEVPMYYISYSTSAFAALQIWETSLDDFDSACKTWSRFVKTGTCNRGYMETIEKCGLRKFTEDGAVQSICRPALDAVKTDIPGKQ